MASTVNGRVYTWGCNDSKQCGNNSVSSAKPGTVNMGNIQSRVMEVTTGEDHSLMLTYDGMLYGFGCN